MEEHLSPAAPACSSARARKPRSSVCGPPVRPPMKTRALRACGEPLSYAHALGVGDGNGWTVTGKGAGVPGGGQVIVAERMKEIPELWNSTCLGET